ncbi:MAG: hypothetical protein JRH19_19335 [Deltaproteobacteria bacterium]|nr:hypothetical protein [Deltaproteobacteria bacterium]
MIYYLATKKYCNTMTGWFDHYADLLAGRLRILPYECLRGRIETGTYIFSDIERLSPRTANRLSLLWDRMRGAGCRLLNHPVHSLRRYALQQALENDFRLFRANEGIEEIRLPAFLRAENDHGGSLTELIHTRAELATARKRYPHAIAVEFLDTADEDGIYRKYSVMRIGDRIEARHIQFSRNWIVKFVDLIEPAFLDEEEAYVRENPHAEQLRPIFEKAQIEYGRIDYSIKDGRLEIWEINTNPMMITSSTTKQPARAELLDCVGETINQALFELELPTGSQHNSFMHFGVRRGWPWKSQFAR